MARPRPQGSRARPLVEELESRVLLSADLQPIPLDGADGDPDADLAAHVELITRDESFSSQEVDLRQEVVFVDAGVEGHEALVDDLRRASGDGRSLEVFLLSGEADGVAQIADFLADREDLDAVHVISHGAEGAVQLGNTWLSGDSLDSHAESLLEWGDALGVEGDLLFYGCDLAGGEGGADFVQALGKVTGADVAASVDATGAAVLGGDWDLEHRVGDVESALALEAGSLQGVLANQPPENSVPGPQTTAVDEPLLLSDAAGNGISVTDPDAGSAELEITLQITNGTVTIAGPSEPVDVNTEVSNQQTSPRVARDAAGNTVVVWASEDQDADGFGIFAQRYDVGGNPIGAEFQVNTEELSDQSEPAISMDANGDFVVVWQSEGQDGDSWGIYAQRYDSAGVAQGAEFVVNSETNTEQRNPDVEMDDAGNFVVVWQSLGQDGNGEGVYAQRFAASGVPQGSEFQVHTASSGDQANAAIAMDASGDFVVVWTSDDGGSNEILAQRFDASGVAQGAEFTVNSYTPNDQRAPDVAMDDVGNFVVAWQSLAQDGADWGVYAQRFDASGVAQGSEFRVNSTTSQEQSSPGVAMDADGDFAITWQGKPGNFDVFLQQYEADGTAVGVETQVNTFAGGDQLRPDIAMDADGDHFVVWEGKSGGGSNSEVQGSHVPYASNITFVSGDGVDDSLVVLRGTLDDLNQTLDGMVFTPTVGFSGTATIQITTNDLGNTGGGDLIDSDTVTIHVGAAVNEAPLLDASAALVFSDVAENALDPPGDTVAALLGSAGTDPIADADGDPEGIAVVGVDDGNGTWQYSTNAGGSWTAFGTVSDGSAVLLDGASMIRFVPNADYAGTAGDLTFRAWDQTNGASGDTGVAIAATGGSTSFSDATETATLDVLAVNDAPLHSVPPAQTTAEDVGLVFSSAGGNAIRIADVDATSLEVRLTASGGNVTLSQTSGLSFSQGDGTADSVVTLQGSPTAVNAALEGLTFTPDADWSGSATLRVETSDLGGSGPVGTADDIVSIDVTAVNDAPTQLVPGIQEADDARTVVFSSSGGNAIQVSDVEAGTVQVTLRAANGTVTLGSLAGLSFGAGDGSSDDVVTFAGSLPAVNAALEGLRFQAGATFEGVASVEVTTDDLGGTGAGGALSARDSIAITVGFVETLEPEAPDAPPEESPPEPEPDPDPVPEEPVVVGALPDSPDLDRGLRLRIPFVGFTPDSLPEATADDAPEAAEPALAAVESIRRDRGEAVQLDDLEELSTLPRDRAIAALQIDRALDGVRDQLSDEDEIAQGESQTVFASVRAMALAVSTGSLAALLRGGSLLALTFSSLPIWNGFDPLAVLAMSTVERKRRADELRADEATEDEAVARMFDES